MEGERESEQCDGAKQRERDGARKQVREGEREGGLQMVRPKGTLHFLN